MRKVNFFRYHLYNFFLVLVVLLIGALTEVILQIWLQDDYLCFLGACYGIFSTSFLFFLYKVLYPFYILKKWNKAVAKIVKIEVLELRVSAAYGVSAIYQFLLEYKYEIDSTTYTSNRIAFDKDSTMIYGNKSFAINIKNRYQNKNIPIFYNPEKLQNSVIIPRLSKRTKKLYIILMIMSLFMLGFGYFLFQNGIHCR